MEIGKAFRLCRFYPASHPSVQHALASVSAALPALARAGAVELRIGTSGFLAGHTPVAGCCEVGLVGEEFCPRALEDCLNIYERQTVLLCPESQS